MQVDFGLSESVSFIIKVPKKKYWENGNYDTHMKLSTLPTLMKSSSANNITQQNENGGNYTSTWPTHMEERMAKRKCGRERERV